MDVITLALAKKYAKDLKSNITSIAPSMDGASIIFTLVNGSKFSIPLANATPTIGENGKWFINGVDTGKPSQGEKGDSYTLTDEDKQEIVNRTLALIPNGDEVSY